MDLLNTPACSLPTAERPLRLAEFDEFFTRHVTAVTTTDAPHRTNASLAVELSLTGDPGLRARVLDLTARESACCSFFIFDLQDSGDAATDLLLTVTVPPEHADILDSLVERARENSA